MFGTSLGDVFLSKKVCRQLFLSLAIYFFKWVEVLREKASEPELGLIVHHWKTHRLDTADWKPCYGYEVNFANRILQLADEGVLTLNWVWEANYLELTYRSNSGVKHLEYLELFGKRTHFKKQTCFFFNIVFLLGLISSKPFFLVCFPMFFCI